MELIPNVVIKNSLAKHATYHNLITDLSSKIMISIPKLETLRMDPELTKLVSNSVENSIKNKDSDKFDKDAIVLQIINKLFDLTPEESSQIENQIEFLKNNKQIKKTSIAKQALKFSLDWVARKFL